MSHSISSVSSSSTSHDRDYKSHGDYKSKNRAAARDNLDPRIITRTISHQKTTQAIIDYWKEHQEEFNYIHYAATFNQLSKLRDWRDKKEDIRTIADRACTLLDTFAPRDIATSLNGLAKMNIHHVLFFQRCALKVVEHNLSYYNPQHLANIANAYAKLEIKDEALFQHLAQEISRRNLTDFSPQALANIANGYAKLGIKDEALFQHLSQEIIKRKLASFNSQDLAHIVNAYAKLNIKNEALFQQLAQEIIKRNLTSFNSQDLANITNAYAKLEIKNEALFQHLAKKLLNRDLIDFEPQHLANITNAYAKLEIKDKALFQHLAKELIKRKLTSFNPQELANIANAYAKLEIKNEALFQHLAKELLKRNLADFNPQELANITNAYAKLEIKNEALFQHLAKELLKRNLADFNPQHLANIAVAFAHVGIRTEELFQAIEVSIKIRDLSSFNKRDLCNILWAFAITDYLQSAVTPQLIAAYQKLYEKSPSLLRVELSQLHQVELALKHEVPEVKVEWNQSLLNEILNYRQLLLQGASKSSENSVTISKTQQAVFQELRKIEPEAKLECCIEGLDVDIFLPKQKQIIEVHGPTHYLEGSKKVDGTTAFKELLLAKMGYSVSTVPYYEWHDKSTKERSTLLQQFLKPQTVKAKE